MSERYKGPLLTHSLLETLDDISLSSRLSDIKGFRHVLTQNANGDWEVKTEEIQRPPEYWQPDVPNPWDKWPSTKEVLEQHGKGNDSRKCICPPENFKFPHDIGCKCGRS